MVRALKIPLARLDDGGAGLAEPFDRTLARWLVLSEASNSINRCMGLPDLYPFVISPVAAEKLGFVHELLGGAAAKPCG